MSDDLKVLIVTGMWPSAAQPDYGAFVRTIAGALARQPGVSVEIAPITTRESGRLRTPLKYGGLTVDSLMKGRGADVIWGHSLFPAGAAAAAAGRTFGTPWVLTAHGMDVANLERGSVRRATRFAVKNAAGVTAVSHWLAGRLADRGIVEGPIDVVNMGVDLDRFTPAARDDARRDLKIPPDGSLVLAVGGLTERKNPRGLIAAVARLRNDGAQVRLAFVGAGPEEQAMRGDIDRLGLQDAVIFGGLLETEGVARWMAACDLLALVSDPEPLGIVALEALASGRPVVLTSEGGAREILEDDRGAGAIVDPGDPEAVARGIADVLAVPAVPERCRALAARHDVNAQAEKMAAILAGAGGRR